MNQVPWDDCKVAFGVDADTDAIFAWAERFKKHFPKGWEFVEVDNAGARTVVVFRVDGRLDERDGESVVKSLRSLEGATRAAAHRVTLQLKGSASPTFVEVASLEAASRVVTEWQDEQGIGASGCGVYHGQVSTDGVQSHRISYNGRVWPVGAFINSDER